MIIDLHNRIKNLNANLAVIGLGYVGLPVACEFARAGFMVLGLDILPERVDRINAGISPIEGAEPGLQELLIETLQSGQFKATTDYTELSNSDIILVCVDTPIDRSRNPQYLSLKSALESIASNFRRGALVIIESTISPGTMLNVVQPILESNRNYIMNKDFFLGNCPERVMPGKLLKNIRSVSRVVGGMTPETAEVMVSLYRHIVDAELDAVDCITAELVKTVENTYRDVQIAFANEVALICEKVGGNVWKVRDLVNKSPGRHMLNPGAGVGGHCIPKDPWLLASSVFESNVSLRVIPAAREVNDSMPYHVIHLLEDSLESMGRAIADSRVLIMGFAYLEESDDSRNSPSQALVERLKAQNAEVVVHDPYVNGYSGSVLELAKDSDAVILMVKHTEYKNVHFQELRSVMRTPILIDGRGFYDKDEVQTSGMLYRAVGIAHTLP